MSHPSHNHHVPPNNAYYPIPPSRPQQQPPHPHYNNHPQPYPQYPNHSQPPQYWGQPPPNQPAINGYSRPPSSYYESAPVRSDLQQQQFAPPTQNFPHPPLQTHPPKEYLPASQSAEPSIPVSISPALLNPSRTAPMSSTTVQLDTPSLLISLAEEYLDAAHQLAPSIALTLNRAEAEAYGTLVSTALGCYATALKNVKIAPRLEAKIRLRYAGVLFEETDNSMDAETALSNGISLCERNRYFDLKYAMQLLLAKFLAKKNPKAALKALEGHATEAQTYQHFSWLYAFRLLRAFYSLESGGQADVHAAVQSLRIVESVALQQQDYSIYMTSALLEAVAFMKSTAPEATQSVQSALAKAWTHQFNVGNATQLIGIAHFIQVACSIRHGNPGDMQRKLKDMQTMMDGTLTDGSWDQTSDTIAIPINRTPKSSASVSQDTRNVLGIGSDGRDNLMLSFLSARDAYAINYILCGMVNFQKNSQDHKSFDFFKEALETLEGVTHRSSSVPDLLPNIAARNSWRGQLICYVHAYLAFLMAQVGDWGNTKLQIERLKDTAKRFEVSLARSLGLLANYLSGVLFQGTGRFEAALEVYESTEFDLSVDHSTNPSTSDTLDREISLLAGLNRLSILQLSDRRSAEQNTACINSMESFCARHPNRGIQTAFHLLLATIKLDPEAQIFEVKKNLKAALQGAQETANSQFTCIILNFMCSRFFTNVVSEQAEKSANAAAATAMKTGSPLWRSVAEGMLGRCYEVHGKMAEGQEKLQSARNFSRKALLQ